MKSNDSVNYVPASTQLNGTTDKPVKPQQSSNKKKSAKPVAPVDAVNSSDTVAETNQLQRIQSPQLFADEIGIADETTPAMLSDRAATTKTLDETNQSGVGDTLMQPNKSENISISAKPGATDEPNVSGKMTSPTAPAENIVAVDLPTLTPTDAISETDATAAADEIKTTRVSRKQSREELEGYKAEYLVPVKIEKRHTVVLDDDLWKELDYIVRRIGDSEANTTSFVNAIIRNHLKEIRPKVEVWRKL